jgi:paraquat-inducible protein B
VLHEGIQVGRISGLDLVKGELGAEIRISIDAEYAGRVRANTRFWNESGFDAHAGIDGFEVKFSSVETILTGAISFATPGSPHGKVSDGRRFPLFADRKAAWREYRENQGLRIELRTPRLGSLADEDPVLYRGVNVGRVLGHRLEEDARTVRIRLQIDSRYAPLVRSNSVFWNASGIHSDLSLTGLHVDVSSLEALLQGAVAFATPDHPGPQAEPGAQFDLAPKAKDRWRKWAPEIPLAPPAPSVRTD